MEDKILKSSNDKYSLPKEVYEKARIAISTPKSEPVSKECERCLELVWKNNELLMKSLVASFVRTYGNYYEQDFLDVGVDSLLTAIKTYNPVEYNKENSDATQSKNVMFSTYATKVILNGLRVKTKYYKTRHSKAERSVSSFEDTVLFVGDGERLIVNDFLTDDTYEQDMASIWQIIPNIDRFIEVLNLDDKKTQIVKMFSEGKNQEQIAKILGVTRSNISLIKVNIERPFKLLMKQGEKVALLHERNGWSFNEITKIMGIDTDAEAIYDTYKYVFFDGKRPKEFLPEFKVGSQSYKSKMVDSKESRQRANVSEIIKQYANIIDKLLYVTNMNEEQSGIIKLYSQGVKYSAIIKQLSVSKGKISKSITMFYVKVQNIKSLYKKISDLREGGRSDERIAKDLYLRDEDEVNEICEKFLYAFKNGDKPGSLQQKPNSRLQSEYGTKSSADIEEGQK